ncbi:unnamed protein product [Brassica oleracea var. botrytis]
MSNIFKLFGCRSSRTEQAIVATARAGAEGKAPTQSTN